MAFYLLFQCQYGGNVDADTLERFKQEFKAILNDDQKELDDWADEVQQKMDSLEDKLSEEDKDNIIDTIQANWDDDEKIQEFVGSFKKGTPERDYAEAVADLRAYMDLDDESKMSKQDKLKALISAYNAKGMEIPKELANITDEKEFDKLFEKNTETKVNENPNIESIKSVKLKSAARNLTKLGVKINGKAK